MCPVASDLAPDVLLAIGGEEPRQSLRGELEADGCDVRVAPETEPVASLLERDGVPDVIVLEAPRGRVLERCQELRRRYAGLLLVLVSEANAMEDRVAALRAGADDYVGEPFAPRRWRRACTCCCGARAYAGSGRRSCATATLGLNRATREALAGSQRLELTRRSSTCSSSSSCHPGEVLERSLHLPAGLGPRRPRFASNSLEVYVSSLRRKLERDGRAARDPDGARGRLRAARRPG